MAIEDLNDLQLAGIIQAEHVALSAEALFKSTLAVNIIEDSLYIINKMNTSKKE